jgi:HemY protein
MALFGIAVASALFAGNNQSTVTVFWYPHRVDLSLNLVLLGLVLGFLTLHFALRTLSALFSIPQQARQWRRQQQERAIHAALLDGLSHLVAGRFVRARKSAELAVSLEEAVQANGDSLSYAGRLRAISHLLAAESAHALQDRPVRDKHLQQALEHATQRDGHDTREGVLLRAARWSFDDRDPGASMEWLNQLPQGAARRTVALRLRFKTARLAGKANLALETARMLIKHRAFSAMAGNSIARGLCIEILRAAHDPFQLQRAWDSLEVSERQLPDVAIEAARRMLTLEGSAEQSRQWLLPVWDAMARRDNALTPEQRVQLVRVLERSFDTPSGAPDGVWLTRIEAAQMANPRDAKLQYLAGIVCVRLQLWGKAQQLLKQSLLGLSDAALRRDAWQALAVLAEQRQDTEAATQAYREALKAASTRP